MSFSPEQVKSVWSATEERVGFSAGPEISDALVNAGIIPEGERNYASRFVDHHPTEPHLYEGVADTVKNLMTQGNHVLIWTQGEPKHQLYKAASSGILALRRDQEIPEARSRLRAYAHFDKVHDLPNVIGNDHLHGDVVIVDDKAHNIVNIQKQIDKMRTEGTISSDRSVQTVWINQGRTKDQVPEGFTVEEFKKQFTTIEDIRELNERYADVGDSTFLLDWDHTLCNTGAWRAESQKEIARRVSRHSIAGMFVDKKLGLDEEGVSLEKVYTNGMSGSGVKLVQMPSGEQQVVKVRLHDRSRLAREVEGHRLLSDTPLASHLLPIDDRYIHRGVLKIPYHHGTPLREGIQLETLSPGIAENVFRELLTIKETWWSQQEPQFPKDHKSMQRAEWHDTKLRLETRILPILAQQAGVPTEKLRTLELDHNGVRLPSVDEVVAFVNTFFTSPDRVPFAINAHNDATGANVIVNESGDWKLLDYEWAGKADPAEALARMIKQISTATISNISGHVTFDQRKLDAHVDCSLPPLAVKLQQIGTKRAKDFEDRLGDPDLYERVQRYMIGSYLREAALSEKRGGSDAAVFALLNAGRLYANYEVYPQDTSSTV